LIKTKREREQIGMLRIGVKMQMNSRENEAQMNNDLKFKKKYKHTINYKRNDKNIS
jgi:hypothetical protein